MMGVLNASIPDLELAGKLVSLADDPDRLAALGRCLPDDRLEEAKFLAVLEIDIRHASVWLLRHCIGLSGSVRSAACGAPRPRAVVFLPRYALAANILRRALPFAALGYDTEIVLGRGVRVEARQLKSFLEALGISKRIRLVSGRRDLRGRVSGASFVAATGRISTLRRIRRCVGPERMLGAAGRCAIVIGGSESELDNLRRVLARSPRPSCSVARAFLVGAGKNPGRYRRLYPKELSRTLARLHPSIVLTTSERWQGEVLEQGYQATMVAPDGSVADMEGFGCDPVFGWPGDWML